MKKAMTMVLAAAMCMSMAVGAMANGIQPRAATCPECNGSMSKKVYEIDRYPTSKECYRGGEHYDSVLVVETWEGDVCNNSDCGYYEGSIKTKEYRTCPNE